jgi:hypothetical protein
MSSRLDNKRRRTQSSADVAYERASSHLGQHADHIAFDSTDIGFDLLQRTGRRVTVEVAVEIDLIADDADLTVSRIALAVSIQASGTCGFTSRSKKALTLSASGTFSVSRSSGSGSGLPSRSRQRAADWVPLPILHARAAPGLKSPHQAADSRTWNLLPVASA